MNKKLEDGRSSLSKQRTNLSLYTKTTNRSDTFVSDDLDRIDGLSISIFGREKTDLSDLGENDAKTAVIIETPRKLDRTPRMYHKETVNMGYEQTRDSGVFKRTRKLFRIPQPRGLPKWPASFELSGTKLCDIEKHTCEDAEQPEKADNRDVDNPLPPLNFGRVSTYPTRMRVSQFFSSDYGMRRQRTDTFSGYGKRGSVKDNFELEKELEQKVKRHVYACQVLGNARRGSPAVQSFTALREAMSPRQKQLPMLGESYISPRGLVRINTSFLSDKTSSDLKENKKQPVALVIRTRDNTGRQKLTRDFFGDTLPEIIGRTLIAGSGFDI